MTVSSNKPRVNTMETIGRNIFQSFSQHNFYCQGGSLVKTRVVNKGEVWSQTVWDLNLASVIHPLWDLR